MSHFIVTFDYDLMSEVMDTLKTIPNVAVTSKPLRNGTVKIKTNTRDLDAESRAIHAIEDIPGILDVRLIDK